MSWRNDHPWNLENVNPGAVTYLYIVLGFCSAGTPTCSIQVFQLSRATVNVLPFVCPHAHGFLACTRFQVVSRI